MNRLVKKTNDVYLAPGCIISIGDDEVNFLKSKIPFSSRGRVRINLHPNDDDLLHEMLIAVAPNSYIQPHKHPLKSEAFHIVYGAVDIVLFGDDGEIQGVISLAHGEKGVPFYYRMSKPTFHTLIIKSDLLIVHEITNGPFKEGGTIFGDFAPNELDVEKIDIWKSALIKKLKDKS